MVLDGSPLQVLLAVLLPASLLGLTARRLGLSSIVGYVAAGALVGPVLGLVDITSPVLDFLRELGIILITFQIGLTIRLDSFPKWGAGGVVLVELVLVGGLMSLAGVLLDLGFVAVFILALMALNTSSAVVFHLLEEDRQNVEEPVVGIALGVGAFEDIISIVGLALLSTVALSEEVPLSQLPRLLFLILVTMMLMLVFATRIAKHVIHHFGLADKELLIILSAVFVIAFAFVGDLLGLSTALGAFVAGLAVSSIEETEQIRDSFLSFTDVAALVFFASIGASLPPVMDVPLVAIVVGISILVILVKYFSFSISSWLVGADRRDAFQIGLYMIAISEFGIIIASEGFKSGIVSEQIYLVSIVAMVLSTIIASSSRNYRSTISQRLSSLIPQHFASLVENTMSRVRGALASDRAELQDLRLAATDLAKRGAIVTLLAFLIGFLSETIPPLFGENATIVKLVIVGVGSVMVLATVIESRSMLSSLVQTAMRGTAGDGGRGRVSRALTELLYILMIGFVAVALVMFYSPFIASLLEVFLTGETTSMTIVVLVLVILLFLARRIFRLMDRIESLFRIP